MAQAPFPITPALVAIANDYANINRVKRGYIADDIAPRIKVDSPLFRYPEYKIEEAFTLVDNQIDRKGQLNEITSTAGEATGSTKDYGILEKISFRDVAASVGQSIPFSLKTRAVIHVMDTNMLNREVRVSALAMSASSYNAGYVDDRSAGTKWSDFTNSDPYRDIIDANEGMLIPGNIGVTSGKVLNILMRHPKLSVALGGSLTSGKIHTKAEIASLFGLDDIYVGRTLRQTSKPGQSLTTGLVWPDSFAIMNRGAVGINGEGLDLQTPTFLQTFQWGGIVSGENPYRPGEFGLYGGVGVYTGESLVEKIVAPFAGYLFQNVL